MKKNNLNLDSRFTFAIASIENFKQRNQNAQTVFDIGSGNEKIKNSIESMGMQYRSFDLHPANENVSKWNIEYSFPFEGRADIIVMLEVIEHLNNPWTCMENISKILKPGGLLVMSTPNPGWSESRLHLLSKGFLNMFTEEDLNLNHHVFTPWPHIIEYLLHEKGFDQVIFTPLGNRTKIRAYPFWGLKIFGRIIYRSIKKIIEIKDSRSIGALYGINAIKQMKV